MEKLSYAMKLAVLSVVELYSLNQADARFPERYFEINAGEMGVDHRALLRILVDLRILARHENGTYGIGRHYYAAAKVVQEGRLEIERKKGEKVLRAVTGEETT